MKKGLPGIALLLPLLAGAETVFSDGFESGFSKWDIQKSPVELTLDGVSSEGAQSARIRYRTGAKIERKWANVIYSKPVPAQKGLYRLTAKLQFPENYGCAVGVVFCDRDKKRLSANSIHYGSKPGSATEWYDHVVEAPAYYDETAWVYVKISMPVWLSQTFRIDDVKIERLPDGPQPPPWKPQYKLRPEEAARLTAADFPGPDGIVYPDFTHAGVRPGIHDRADAVVLKLSDFGVKADDGKDCSAAFEAAVAALPPEGGVIRLDAGRYRLSRLLLITRDNVMIRGAGRDRTKLDLDYDTGDGRIDLYGLKDGSVVSPQETIHLIARPQQLVRLRLELDGRPFRDYARSLHSGNQSFTAGQLPEAVTPGKHKLAGVAVYSDKSEFRKEITIEVRPGVASVLPPWTLSGVINFRGNGYAGPEYLLAEDGVRGSDTIVLKDANHPFRPGDAVNLKAPETPRRRAETRNACRWGSFRSTILFIDRVDGAKITFNQPMRIDYPVVDGAFIRRAELVKGGGVEGMTIEMKNDYWLSSVLFHYASDCRARDVRVVRCGRNPVYAYHAKFCSILECEFDDGWFKGGGGTSYVGWEASYDCLMDGVVTRRMRHAPMLQWSASGNVIRNGVFHNSDAQWHSGWTNENLFENCSIVSDTTENGGYGYGLLASAPEDGAHGPNGPRNVVYNCDVFGGKGGVWLGGMNENWIFAHNRFRAEAMEGIFLKATSFDHILYGNTFILKSEKAPLILFGSADCGGVELRENRIYGGSGKLSQGLSGPFRAEGNRFFPYRKDAPRPQPAVPSIYEYQLRQRGGSGQK